MSPLVRLADQVDELLPQFVLVAILRWIASFFYVPLKVVLSKTFPKTNTVFTRLCMLASLWMVLAHIMLLLFVILDAVENFGPISRCEPHTLPRPLGISTGVVLVCFVLTTKLQVSAACVLTFLCVRERSVLTGLSAVVTSSMWLRSFLCTRSLTALFIVSISAISTSHAILCRSPASATLSMVYSMWTMCMWLGVCRTFAGYVFNKVF